MYKINTIILLLATLLLDCALGQEDCEVCIKTIEKFAATLSRDVKENPKLIEVEFKKFCSKVSNSKESLLCYYLENSGTGILDELCKAISMLVPAEIICKRLKKKEPSICELKYHKNIDLKHVDLKKLKVRDLKNILNDWGEVCLGCVDKADFIKRVEELKSKHGA